MNETLYNNNPAVEELFKYFYILPMQHNLFVFFCFKVFLVIRYHKRGHADDAKMILHTLAGTYGNSMW